MVKISALPAGQALTGAELIAIVQNAETRRSSVQALVDLLTPAPVTTTLANARWVRVANQAPVYDAHLEIALSSEGGC